MSGSAFFGSLFCDRQSLTKCDPVGPTDDTKVHQCAPALSTRQKREKQLHVGIPTVRLIRRKTQDRHKRSQKPASDFTSLIENTQRLNKGNDLPTTTRRTYTLEKRRMLAPSQRWRRASVHTCYSFIRVSTPHSHRTQLIYTRDPVSNLSDVRARVVAYHRTISTGRLQLWTTCCADREKES